nr:antibiotic biosynthesis monooxygenase [Neobacillus sp. Marseille-Q6967]
MNLYITAGTVDYLIGIEKKHRNETMVTIANGIDGAMLVHETNGGTVFKEPRRYTVIGSAGLFPKKGFVALNNIPVTEEGRPVFEHQIKGLLTLAAKERDLDAIRLLRPLSSNTYIILTIWKTEIAYQNAKSLLDLQIKKEGVDLQPKIFVSSPYIKTYTIIENDDSSH